MVAALQMQSTRQHILEYLQRHGRATVKELGSLLGLTSTGIRQHLTVLERDGLVDAREERGRVGRPTLVYSLTEKADALFPKTYDALATVLLEEIRCSRGERASPRPPPQGGGAHGRPLRRTGRGQASPGAGARDGPHPGGAGLPRGRARDETASTTSTSSPAPSPGSPSRTAPSAPSTSTSCASSPAATPA